MSKSGVPSKISTSVKAMVSPFKLLIFTIEIPIWFGRCGPRMANIPCSISYKKKFAA